MWEPCGGLGCAVPYGVLERVAGCVQFRIKYGNVAWEGRKWDPMIAPVGK